MIERLISKKAFRQMQSYLASLLLLLILAGCSSTPTTSIQPSGSTPTDTPAPTSTGSINTPTVSPSPAASTATSQPTPGSTSRPAGFSVTGISVSVKPRTTCNSETIFTYTATITVSPGTGGGKVSYTWLRFDNVPMPTQSVTFAPGETTKTISTDFQKNIIWTNGEHYWEALKVVSPNTLTSARATGTYACDRSVTGINVSVSPTVYPCAQSSADFALTATFTITNNSDTEDVIYGWQANGQNYGLMLDQVVPAGQTQFTVTYSWTGDLTLPNRAYDIRVVVVTPNSFSSSPAIVTKNC